MTTERTSPQRITASFDSMDRARKTITALERAGIEGADISLEGPAARRAARDLMTQERDAGMTSDWARFGIAGGAGGLIIGAIGGLIIGYLLFGRHGWAILAAVLGMAAVGLAIGGLVTPIAATPTSPDVDQTYDTAVGGEVRVAVRAGDSAALEKIAEILRDQHPRRVERGGGQQAAPGL